MKTEYIIAISLFVYWVCFLLAAIATIDYEDGSRLRTRIRYVFCLLAPVSLPIALILMPFVLLINTTESPLSRRAVGKPLATEGKQETQDHE